MTDTVDAYLAALPAGSRAVLAQVRAAIRGALPEAAEVISYKIPAYRLPAGVALYFACWKAHYSIYPATAAVREAFATELAGYELSKGTIRFPLDAPVPTGLIAAIAQRRALEDAERKRVLAEAAKARRATKAPPF